VVVVEVAIMEIMTLVHQKRLLVSTDGFFIV